MASGFSTGSHCNGRSRTFTCPRPSNLQAARNPQLRTTGALVCCDHQPQASSHLDDGLRVSELTRLRVCDIDSGRMAIRVKQGKENKDRYVPLSPRLLDELRTYWRIGRPSHWLFPGQCADGNLSRHGIAAIYTAVKTKAGINNAGGIHYASALLCFA